jgi:hypothetical protein
MTKRTSGNYVATLHVGSVVDMQELALIRKTVKVSNQFAERQKRVVIRGRKPLIKRQRNRTGNFVSYDFGGNIVGGIMNATVYDVYIYDR